MAKEISAIEPDVDPELAKALGAVITAADGPPARALVVDHLVEEIVSVVASEPSVDADEWNSVLPVLDAADEYGERMGAITSCPEMLPGGIPAMLGRGDDSAAEGNRTSLAR
jgi:hypothetical protein